MTLRFPCAACTLGRRVSWPMAALLALTAVAAPAHDWPSPGPERPGSDRQGPGALAPAADWPGWIWRGPGHGAPAAPSARDCRRAPAPFEVPGPPGWEPQLRRGSSGATPAPGAGKTSDGALARDLGRAAERAGEPAGERAPDRAALRDAPADAARDRVTAAPAASPAAAPRSAVDADSSHRESRFAPHVTPHRAPASPQPADEPVTAGVVDDNADFGEYQAFRARWHQVPRRDLDIAERVLVDVRDERGRAVPDARIEALAPGGVALPLWARTDAGGRAWLLPQPDLAWTRDARLELRVSKGSARALVTWRRGQRDVLQVRLDGAAAGRAQLDIVFAIDATGSMGDEIDKLKRSMAEVADRIARLPSQPDLCFGLVAYRDRGDEFFVRGADLTNDLGAFQFQLGQLRAGGGGDYPEAMNEALHTAIHRLSWRGEGTARLLVLLADAPPQLGYGGPQYDADARGALARGIKILGVGASGLDRQGELVMRQLAQATGGRFVFLTYADARRPSSGPGRETVHDVRNYSVETLDRLLVRLVTEEMARWPDAAP